MRFDGYIKPWMTRKLGDMGTFIKGAPLSKADISDEGTPFILYGELYTTYSEVSHSVKRKTDKIVEKQFYSKIGDVIMPTSGETPEDIATASCIMLPNVILAGDLLIYRTEQIDGRFVSYAIKNKVNKQISSVAQGKSVVHVRADELSKICITFPVLDEQKKILDFLELLDTRITTQQNLIESLKKYTVRNRFALKHYTHVDNVSVKSPAVKRSFPKRNRLIIIQSLFFQYFCKVLEPFFAASVVCEINGNETLKPSCLSPIKKGDFAHFEHLIIIFENSVNNIGNLFVF